MSSRFLPHRRFLWVSGVLVISGTPALGQLAAKSPFMPAQTAAPAGPTAGAPLEYRGYMETSAGRLFRLYDPAKKTSTWVRVDERNADFEVTPKQFDEAQNTLTLEYQGKTITLEERKAKVVSSGSAAAAIPPPVAVPTNVAPAVTQAVVLNPTPADEQRRLDAVAAEVARRRALREQATQQISQGVAPQVALPQNSAAQTGQVPQPGVYQPNNSPGGQRPRGPQPPSTR